MDKTTTLHQSVASSRQLRKRTKKKSVSLALYLTRWHHWPKCWSGCDGAPNAFTTLPYRDIIHSEYHRAFLVAGHGVLSRISIHEPSHHGRGVAAVCELLARGAQHLTRYAISKALTNVRETRPIFLCVGYNIYVYSKTLHTDR